MRVCLPVLVSVLLLSTISIPNNNLEITAFDVGNADAFMIKTPDNKYMMIDTGKGGYNGGKSQAELLILKYFADNGIKNLDSIIVTHFDNDHCGGPGANRAYDIDSVDIRQAQIQQDQSGMMGGAE